ncbi:hypothetical protein JTB14_022209 [Gonioctena quinquepunctata]|nr:hypothetical protein JTB14_022209 [Gonioctena quinquepunctata]
MFVVSQSQLRKMIRVDEKWKSVSLLDLGAGDGGVTAHMAPLFEKIYATDISAVMKNLLKRKEYEILEIDSWHLNRKFDVISCLNLLDRCEEPRKLLSQMRASLNPDGKILMAIVLPFSAYVESGTPDNKPKEMLPINGFLLRGTSEKHC